MTPLEPPKEYLQQPLHLPRQLSPAEKKAVCGLTNALNPVDAQELLDELADALECKTIKTNPLRWFHALVEKQKSGAFIPVGAVRIAERRKRQEQEQVTLTKEKNLPPRSTDREIGRNALAQVKRSIGIRPSSAES